MLSPNKVPALSDLSLQALAQQCASTLETVGFSSRTLAPSLTLATILAIVTSLALVMTLAPALALRLTLPR